jgi:hypothetical protein
MNSWIVAANSKDSRGGSSPSAAARNAEEVLLRSPLLGQLWVDLRLVCLGDFVSLYEKLFGPAAIAASLSPTSPCEGTLFDEMLRMSTKWASFADTTQLSWGLD